MKQQRPLIMFTNDDGIQSPGLWTVAAAFADIAEILVVAPQEQQSGMGRSLPITSQGRIYPRQTLIGEAEYTVYGVDGTPAQAVQHGILELAERQPALVVSGINYGENTGNGVTISGTVGAALEAASLGIPALAVSQQTAKDLHLTYSPEVDFVPAAYFARIFGLWLMEQQSRPIDVDILKIDIPVRATVDTEWRITRVSRRRVYWPTRPERADLDQNGRLGYRLNTDPSLAEPDSDVYAIMHDNVVSVTPMSLDMTSRIDLKEFQQLVSGVSAKQATVKPTAKSASRSRRKTPVS